MRESAAESPRRYSAGATVAVGHDRRRDAIVYLLDGGGVYARYGSCGEEKAGRGGGGVIAVGIGGCPVSRGTRGGAPPPGAAT